MTVCLDERPGLAAGGGGHTRGWGEPTDTATRDHIHMLGSVFKVGPKVMSQDMLGGLV